MCFDLLIPPATIFALRRSGGLRSPNKIIRHNELADADAAAPLLSNLSL
jgi:hypothetical protein